MQWVINTGGIRLVSNNNELKNMINVYLNNPHLDNEGRVRLANELCYKVDGKSSERMVDAIDDIMKKS